MFVTRTRVALKAGSAAADPNRLWMEAVGASAGTVTQETRQYRQKGGDEEGVPVRCMIAQRRIARGERLCVVPPHMVVTGRVADTELRRLAQMAQRSSDASATLPLRIFESLVERLHAMPRTASPRLLASRDALLVTALLYLYHSPRYAALLPPTPLAAWVRTMPRRIPPMGLLLAGDVGRSTRHTPLQRRLTLGDMTVPLLPGTDAKAAATELMVAAVEEKGLVEGLRTPRTEVVLTESMLADFHAGRHMALTARQFEAAAAHTLRHSGSAAVRQLAAMEAELQQDVLLPLLRAISPAFGEAGDTPLRAEEDPDLDILSSELAAMRWAHFTMRSRALNVGFRRGPVELGVVPFLDRLNHAHSGANVVYSCAEQGGEVMATAARTIRAGEELVLRYSHVGQRGCLFGDTPAAAATATTGRQERMDAVTRKVRAIEARQRREMEVDEDAAAAAECPVFSVNPSAASATSGYSARGHGEERAEAEREAAKEATWLWRYGFLRSDEERAYEASHLWSKGLRDRLAHLTDVRRKGTPGAFVVGVPEGLEHLREQRESLERERYGNTRVFPPQQT